MRAEGAGEVEEAAAPEAAAAREVRRAAAQVRARHRPDLVGEAPAAVAVEAEGRTEDLEIAGSKSKKKRPRLGLFFCVCDQGLNRGSSNQIALEGLPFTLRA